MAEPFRSPPGSSRDQNLPATVDAVFVDAGGVLVTPDADRVRDALATAAPDLPPPTDAALIEAHYRAMAAVDLARSAPETFDAYLPAYLASVGLADDGTTDGLDDDGTTAGTRDGQTYDAALASFQALWSVPYRLWTRPLPGVPEALAALAATGLPLVVVSNADGRVADALAGLLQVGPGPGVEVVAVIDSGVVGVAKPDPAIFGLALDALRDAGHGDVDPARVIHVGDAHSYDVGGARAAGVTPVFVDPLGLHPDPGCTVVNGLVSVAAQVL